MSSSKSTELENSSASEFLTEAVLDNLHKARSKMVANVNEAIDKSLDFELSNYLKYFYFENIRSEMYFMDDNEDIGPKEDLIMLGIK